MSTSQLVVSIGQGQSLHVYGKPPNIHFHGLLAMIVSRFIIVFENIYIAFHEFRNLPKTSYW